MLRVGSGSEFQFAGDFLQLTVACAHTGRAEAVVLGQNHFDVDPSRFPYFRGIGEDFHAFFYHVVAGGDKTLDALYLNHADAAGADFVDAF